METKVDEKRLNGLREKYSESCLCPYCLGSMEAEK